MNAEEKGKGGGSDSSDCELQHSDLRVCCYAGFVIDLLVILFMRFLSNASDKATSLPCLKTKSISLQCT